MKIRPILIFFILISTIRLQPTAYNLVHLPQELGFALTDSLLLEVSGAVIPEFFWDSRQVVASRDGSNLVVPADRSCDVYGNDIHAQGSNGMNAIQTVLEAKLTGMKIAGAAASAAISVDFQGVTDASINTMRNYYAYADLEWETSEVKLGQYWAPSFVADCFPGVVSDNAGGPFEPYLTAPLIWFKQHYGDVSLLISAVSEIQGSVSAGGNNNADQIFSSEFIRNSQLPALYARLQGSLGKHQLILGVETRTLKPRLEGINGRKVFEGITSFSGFFLCKLVLADHAEIKAKVLYYENGVAEGMLGGYAIKSIDPVTDQRSYTNLRNFTCWVDAFWGKKIQPGIFIGYTKNLGASDCLVDRATLNLETGITSFKEATIGFGTDIDFAFRVSPRIRLNWNEVFTLGCEVEYTAAAYGTVQRNGKVTNTHTVGNVRLLFSTNYYF